MSRNHLDQETSPYLLQHVDNPVHWYPWGEEALQKAREEDKIILLSVGYSACHWCHVMAHESFEDEETAALMNQLFINIKVDREERPDLDKIYQTAHYMLTQKPGGWPLTMFLTPDKHIPFFGGTYFPKDARYGMMPFKELMKRVHAFYQQRRDDIEEQNASLMDTMQRNWNHASEDVAPTAALLPHARMALAEDFDPLHGGFGAAPKFPHPSHVSYLLLHWHLSRAGNEDSEALHMARHSLEHMAEGGLFDQLGGGFCRYSVDDQWMIPHFEKMLYDNGALLTLYAEFSSATGNGIAADTVQRTAQWVMREMQSPEGGYYSSLDADSEGEEGKFYSWEKEEIKQLLDDQEFAAFAYRYGINRPANFEGKWYPHGFKSKAAVAEALHIPEDRAEQLLASAIEKLFLAREQRIHPGRDEKILTSWNALMIQGMASAAMAFKRDDWAQSANKALDFLMQKHWKNGRLLATSKDGIAHLNAYLDDHAYLIDAILTLLQYRWNTKHYRFARQLAEILLDHFQDRENGGFFFTADDHESLIQRPRSFSDEAIPSGNGIAAQALIKLGYLSGESRYLEAAEDTIRAAGVYLQQAPAGHASLLKALRMHLSPPTIHISRAATKDLTDWRDTHLGQYHPEHLCFDIPNEASPDLPPELAAKAESRKPVLYSCQGTHCLPPTHSLKDYLQLLGSP